MSKVNFNYILTMVIVLVLLLISGSVFIQKIRVDKHLDEMKDSIEETYDDGEIDDVEGYGNIYSGVVVMFGSLGSFAFGILVVIILVYDFFLFMFVTLARVVYKPGGDGLMGYRILMTLAYVQLLLFAAFIISSFSVGISLMAIVLLALSVLVVIITGINTYTDRIKM